MRGRGTSSRRARLSSPPTRLMDNFGEVTHSRATPPHHSRGVPPFFREIFCLLRNFQRSLILQFHDHNSGSSEIHTPSLFHNRHHRLHTESIPVNGFHNENRQNHRLGDTRQHSDKCYSPYRSPYSGSSNIIPLTSTQRPSRSRSRP